MERFKSQVDVKIDAVKTAINLGSKYHFGMVYALKDSLKIEFLHDKEIKDVRFQKAKKVSKNLYFYVLKIKKLSDIDDTLIIWLSEAYSLKNK